MESKATNGKPHKEKIYILVELFIKKPVNFPPDQFKKECIAAARLVKRYSDFDFFYFLPQLTNKFNSLFGLLMKKNIDLLDKKYKEYLDKKKQTGYYKLEDLPVTEIKLEKRPAQSIMEFLSQQHLP